MIIPNIHPISCHNSDLVASCRHQFKHFLERSIYLTLFAAHVGSPACIKIRNRSNIVTFRKCTAPGTLTVAVSPDSLWATPHLRAFSCRNAGSPAPPTPSCQRQCVLLLLPRPLSPVSIINIASCPYRCHPKLKYDNLYRGTRVILVFLNERKYYKENLNIP